MFTEIFTRRRCSTKLGQKKWPPSPVLRRVLLIPAAEKGPLDFHKLVPQGFPGSQDLDPRQRDEVFSKPNALKITPGVNPGLVGWGLRRSNQRSLGGPQDQQPPPTAHLGSGARLLLLLLGQEGLLPSKKGCFFLFLLFFKCLFIVERERETESEAGSRFRAVSTEPNAGLELTSHEIVT